MAKLRYIAGFLILCAGAAIAAEPRLAEQKSFVVPLANGENGSAIALPSGNEQVLVLAAQGNPPAIAVYRISAFDEPGPGPGPEPNPQPDPSPNPNPNPQPIPHGPISLIWIEESSERTPEQAKAITDQAIRDALKKLVGVSVLPTLMLSMNRANLPMISRLLSLPLDVMVCRGFLQQTTRVPRSSTAKRLRIEMSFLQSYAG